MNHNRRNWSPNRRVFFKKMLYSLAHFVSGGSASSLPQISEKKDSTRVRLQVPPETKEKKRNLKKTTGRIRCNQRAGPLGVQKICSVDSIIIHLHSRYSAVLMIHNPEIDDGNRFKSCKSLNIIFKILV